MTVRDGELLSQAHTLKGTFWNTTEFGHFDIDDEDKKLSGFIGYGNNSVFAYGSISVPQDIISFIETSGFKEMDSDEFGDGGILFDNTVRAAEVFQSRIYFAGDFIHPSGPYQNLVTASLAIGTDSTDDPTFGDAVKINVFENQLIVDYQNLQEDIKISLYNMSGQFQKSFVLTTSDGQHLEDLSQLHSGAYIYQVSDGQQMDAGKIVLIE